MNCYVVEAPYASLYIAGGSSERLEVVRPLVDSVVAAGVRLEHDWTRCEGFDLGRAPTNDELRRYALDDAYAAMRASVFWLVVPRHKSEGAATEFGMAIATGRPRIVVSGEVGARNIFALFARPDDIFAMHEAALAHVLAIFGRAPGAHPYR